VAAKSAVWRGVLKLYGEFYWATGVDFFLLKQNSVLHEKFHNCTSYCILPLEVSASILGAVSPFCFPVNEHKRTGELCKREEIAK
jgi:hypothetical protein